jgi:flagellar hook-associated protein 1
MLGLFGTLNMTSRSMQVQQQGIEVAGHNMANVNNPAYARQRVAIQTASPISTALGNQGTGADSRQITQIRSTLLDAQITNESSFSGSLDAQQQALQYAQSDLGQQIDRGATGAEGAAASASIGKQHGIGDSISDFFGALQNLSGQPSDTTLRDELIKTAKNLVDRFQSTDQRLSALNDTLNAQVTSDVISVNGILDDVARLNQQIGAAELNGEGSANDLRDTRQQKLEELAKFIKYDAVNGDNGSINVSVGAVTLIDTNEVANHLETFTDAAGKVFVHTQATNINIDVTGGSIHGAIAARDGAIQELRDDLSTLANTLISEINRVHASGFGKNGVTGQNFFEGSDASNISVNQVLVDDPTKIQTSDTAGLAGNKGVVLAMAQLAGAPQTALGNQTFSQRYSHIVGDLGLSLKGVNEQISDQTVVTNMLKSQRDSISGVSIDEEMTDLIKFQKAYQASAQLVNTINEMLETIINMVR